MSKLHSNDTKDDGMTTEGQSITTPQQRSTMWSRNRVMSYSKGGRLYEYKYKVKLDADLCNWAHVGCRSDLRIAFWKFSLRS